MVLSQGSLFIILDEETTNNACASTIGGAITLMEKYRGVTAFHFPLFMVHF
jgi:hypothetical protein